MLAHYRSGRGRPSLADDAFVFGRRIVRHVGIIYRRPSTLVSKMTDHPLLGFDFFERAVEFQRCLQGFAKHRRATELAPVSPILSGD